MTAPFQNSESIEPEIYRKYFHNTFLESSFAAYKELLQNQPLSAEQSTSADSKTNKTNKTDSTKNVASDDVFPKADHEK